MNSKSFNTDDLENIKFLCDEIIAESANLSRGSLSSDEFLDNAEWTVQHIADCLQAVSNQLETMRDGAGTDD